MTMKSAMFSNSTVRPKADKYKFPAIDPPALEGLLEYTPKQLYIYIINLMYHRLTPETYKLWCELTERDVSFPEMTKNGVLETSYSLKQQRDKFKKNKRKTSITTESNLVMSNVKNPNIIPNDILTKLQNSQMLLSMYLLQREKYITFLNDLMTLNFSPAFTKLVKCMVRLASITQSANCSKLNAMHKKLLKIYNNSLLNKNQIVYRCNSASLPEQDNIKLPFVNCILDISRTGTSEQIVPCLLDSGSQIFVCSYDKCIG